MVPRDLIINSIPRGIRPSVWQSLVSVDTKAARARTELLTPSREPRRGPSTSETRNWDYFAPVWGISKENVWKEEIKKKKKINKQIHSNWHFRSIVIKIKNSINTLNKTLDISEGKIVSIIDKFEQITKNREGTKKYKILNSF